MCVHTCVHAGARFIAELRHTDDRCEQEDRGTATDVSRNAQVPFLLVFLVYNTKYM